MHEEFRDIFERIQGIWPSFKCSDTTAKEWFKALEQKSYRDVNDIITELSHGEKFAPNLADIFGALTRYNREARNYFKETREERAENAAFHVKASRVRVRFDDGQSGWEDEWRTVYDKKLHCRRRKIDFVCDYMGGAAVEAEIRSIIPNGSVSELVGKKNWTKNYHSKLDEMVRLVQETLK